MDMGDLIKMGASAFIKSKMSGDAGSGLDLNSLTSALSGLTDGNDENGGLDIGGILSKNRRIGNQQVGNLCFICHNFFKLA